MSGRKAQEISTISTMFSFFGKRSRLRIFVALTSMSRVSIWLGLCRLQLASRRAFFSFAARLM
jgi:hypothetical protein